MGTQRVAQSGCSGWELSMSFRSEPVLRSPGIPGKSGAYYGFPVPPTFILLSSHLSFRLSFFLLFFTPGTFSPSWSVLFGHTICSVLQVFKTVPAMCGQG